MVRMILKQFLPDKTYPSVYAVPWETLYGEGVRGLLFDIDNTLVMHGAPANGRIVSLFAHLHELGFQTTLVSNNEQNRVRSFAESIRSDYVYRAGKPGREGYLKACAQMNVQPAQTIMVGDQLFTDIWGANRAGVGSLLVDPIDPREEPQIRLKRLAERPLLVYIKKKKDGRKG